MSLSDKLFNKEHEEIYHRFVPNSKAIAREDSKKKRLYEVNMRKSKK